MSVGKAGANPAQCRCGDSLRLTKTGETKRKVRRPTLHKLICPEQGKISFLFMRYRIPLEAGIFICYEQKIIINIVSFTADNDIFAV